MIAAGNDNLFRRLAAALGHAEWTEDPRYRDNSARVAHREELNASIDAIVATFPAEYWVELLDGGCAVCSIADGERSAGASAYQGGRDGVPDA